MATPGPNRRLLVAALLLATVLLAGRRPAAGQEVLHWTAIGPGGGTINSLATIPGQPGTLLAGVYDSGVWKTTDGGATWKLVLPVTDEYAIFFVVVSPQDPQVVYAGTGVGTWRSTDGGATWTLATQFGVGLLAISPLEPQILYGASGSGIYKSWDQGATWAPEATLAFGVASITVDPTTKGLVYAGGSDIFGKATLARSTNGGQSWTPLAPNLFASAGDVWGITLEPGNPAAIWACVEPTPFGTNGGVYGSLDGGQTWTRSLPFPFPSGCSLAADPAAPGTLYAGIDLYLTVATGVQISYGIWKTTDNGAHWNQVIAPTEQVNALAVDGGPPGRVYAGLQSLAVIASQDGGATWASASAKLWATAVARVTASPTTPGELYAAAESNVVKSTDGGATWAATGTLPVETDPYLDIFRLAVNPGNDNLVYVATEVGLLRSQDAGASWQVSSSLGAASDLAIDPADPARVYVAGLSTTDNLFQFSDDGGATWSVPPAPPFVQLPPNNFPTPNFEQLVTIAIDPQNPARLYTAGDFFWTSLDRGQTWTQLSPPVTPYAVACLRIDPRPPGALYLAGGSLDPSAHQVYKSLDHGLTWIAADSGLPAGAVPLDLQIDAQTSALYLATPLGVYVSRNGGASYDLENAGLAPGTVNALALDPLQPGKIYAATEHSGVYSSPGVCNAGPQVLCLAGGRFRATVSWSVPSLGAGTGTAGALSDDTGTFWFFSPSALELVVKVVDGRAVNGHFWVFRGALTDTAYTLTITDLVTGAQRLYQNPAGELTSAADTSAFADAEEHVRTAAGSSHDVRGTRAATTRAASAARTTQTTPATRGTFTTPATRATLATAAAPAAANGCQGGATDLCLTGARFQVEVAWQTQDGASGTGQALPLTGDTGAFWFFDAAEVELVIKMIDGRAVNGHFWMLWGSLSDVAYTVTITDTATGTRRVYTNAEGQLASRADTGAF